MFYRFALVSPILLVLAACSKSDPPKTPQLMVNRNTVDFGTGAGFGTYIGQVPQDSLDIKNGGIEDLVVSSISISGDSAFTYVTSQQLPATVPGLQHLLVTFYFAPTVARAYSATATISSNAANSPSMAINLKGQGINPPDGG
jgi:hypothetical protein